MAQVQELPPEQLALARQAGTTIIVNGNITINNAPVQNAAQPVQEAAESGFNWRSVGQVAAPVITAALAAIGVAAGVDMTAKA